MASAYNKNNDYVHTVVSNSESEDEVEKFFFKNKQTIEVTPQNHTKSKSGEHDEELARLVQ